MTGAILALVAVLAMVPAGKAPRALSAPAGSRLPDDRYVMAGGCYAIRSATTGRYIARTDEGFVLGQPDARPAGAYEFCATGGRRAVVELTKTGRMTAVRLD